MTRKLSAHSVGLLSANVLAASALFAAAGGTSWAAKLIGTADIRDQAITPAKIAEGAVTPTKIRTGAVTSSRLAPGAVTTSRLANGSITPNKLAKGAITSSKLARDSVTSVQIKKGAVGTTEIADGSIKNDDLAKNAVTGKKIVDKSITSLDLADDTIGRRHISKNALAMPWPNALHINGLRSTDLVTKAQNAAVYGERHNNIPIPTVESSVARIDSRDLKGLSLVLVRLTVTSDSASDSRGFVRCRAVYGSRSSDYGVAGYQRTASNDLVVGGNTIVIQDFHQFPTTGRNTIDVRCKSTVDHTLAQDISIISIRMGSVANAVVA